MSVNRQQYTWHQHPRLELSLFCPELGNPNTPSLAIYWVANRIQTIELESYIEDVIKWCKQSDCGIRTAYDTFSFKNKQEIVAFLLRWN